MKTILLITIIFLASILNCYKSQSLANYGVARNTGITYSSISSSGNSIPYWKNTTINQNDDNMSLALPLGFDFWYLGQRYTQLSVCSNGYVHFSSTVYDGNDSPSFTSGSGYTTCGTTISYRESALAMGTFGCGAAAPNFYDGTYLALAPFYTDLWVGNNGANYIANSIKYIQTGTAPNRVFTVEYITMDDWSSTTNANYNFQVKLHETSGAIEFVYGTMTSPTGSAAPYGCGLSGIIPNTGRTLANLKMLQTANSSTFNQTVQANLTTIPTSNSRYLFTPNCSTNPTGALTISGITSSALNLAWTNWATNEIGYIIYQSTDNVNFTFVGQTAANATSYAITGLLASTTYYYKVAAVTEGCVSNFITKSATTLGGINKISNKTGNWNTATIWTPTGVPTSADNVIINNGHVVTIDVNGVCNSLTVGMGGTASTLQYSGNTARSITLGGQLVVNATGQFIVNTTSSAIHTLNATSNIIVNGKLDFNNSATSICNTYIKNNVGNTSISGMGSLLDFGNMNINLTNSSDFLNVTSNNFLAINNFLTLSNGQLNLATVNTVSITPYANSSVLVYNTGLILNSTNLTVNTGNNFNIIGNLTVNNGTLNVGNATDEDLQVSGGKVVINNGAINVAGKIQSSGINDIVNLTINGGTITVPSIGSTNTTIAPIDITGVGSKFNMTNGLIIIPKMGGTATQQLGYNISGFSTGSVTGGTLQIGNALTTTSQTMSINSILPIGNLLTNSANATARIINNPLTVLKHITLQLGKLNANNQNITLGGNWADNGGSFLPTTTSVDFNSASAQTIYKPAGETFNNITFTGVGVKTFSSAVTTNSNIIINSGVTVDVGAGNNLLTIKRDFTNSGNFIARKGEVLLNGTVAQNIGGTTLTNFYNLTLNNNAGAKLLSNENLVYTLQLSNGIFNTNGKVFTMLSTANNTARIAPITGTGDITGNVTAQRFAPGGYTGWALIGIPMSSPLTFQDWDDNIYISCPTCPDGSAAGFTSIYGFNETLTAGSYSNPAAYIPITSITNSISPNKGYWVYLGDNYTNTNPITIDVTGTVRKFNTTIPITRTNTGSVYNDGWNLISNPYPSPIKWSALRAAATSTAIDNAIYVYNTDLNAGSGGFATYINGVSSPALNAGGISDTIPMCQGFQVHSTGATAFSAIETIKVGGNPTFLKTAQVNSVSNSAMPLMRLYLNGVNNFHDEAVVYNQLGATNNFDVEYDAIKMAGQDPYAPVIRMVDYSTQQDLQVNGVDLSTGTVSLPLNTTTGYNGTYTIALADYANFPKGACINLYDKYLNTTTNLKSSNYVFTLLDTTIVARFTLNINLSALSITSAINQPNCELPNSGIITAKGLSAGPWNYYWKDENGATVKTSLNKNSTDTLPNLMGGNYTLEVNTVGQCDNNSTDFTVNTFDIPLAQFNCTDTSYLVNNGLVVFTNNSSNANTNTWDFGDLLGTSTNVNPTYNYLSAGIYTVSLITESNTGCLDTTYKKVVIVDNTGINDLQNTFGLLLQTKANNEFVLAGTFSDSEKANIRLINNEGKIISYMPQVSSKNMNMSFDLSSYANGMYYLEITGNTTKVVFKLLVH